MDVSPEALKKIDQKNVWDIFWYMIKIIMIAALVIYLLVVLILDDGWKTILEFITDIAQGKTSFITN